MKRNQRKPLYLRQLSRLAKEVLNEVSRGSLSQSKAQRFQVLSDLFPKWRERYLERKGVKE